MSEATEDIAGAAPANPEDAAPHHSNTFTEEEPFLEHYAIARDLAKYRPNWIRYCDGDSLIGVPLKGEQGRVVHDSTTGRVRYLRMPVGGFIPDEEGAWRPVPFLATYLRSSLIRGDMSIRITPEVRVERDGAGIIAIRTLSVEMVVPFTLREARKQQDLLRDSMIPMVQSFYPLHNDLAVEELLRGPGPSDPHRSALLFRWRATHERIT